MSSILSCAWKLCNSQCSFWSYDVGIEQSFEKYMIKKCFINGIVAGAATVFGSKASNDTSSSGKSNATSLKILLAKEMANEVESKRSAGVIAGLMGLEEDLPAKESIVHHARSDTLTDSKTVNKAQWKEHHQSMRLMTQDLQQFHEYRDVYEVWEDQSGTSFFEDRTPDKLWSSENKSDQSDIVQ